MRKLATWNSQPKQQLQQQKIKMLAFSIYILRKSKDFFNMLSFSLYTSEKIKKPLFLRWSLSHYTPRKNFEIFYLTLSKYVYKLLVVNILALPTQSAVISISSQLKYLSKLLTQKRHYWNCFLIIYFEKLKILF